jgi:hypothetical protein
MVPMDDLSKKATTSKVWGMKTKRVPSYLAQNPAYYSLLFP